MKKKSTPKHTCKKGDYEYVIHCFKKKKSGDRELTNSVGFKTLTDFAVFLLTPVKGIFYAFQTRSEAEQAGMEPNLICLGDTQVGHSEAVQSGVMP